MAPNSAACSSTRTLRPRCPSASAVASPPRPPPTMRMGRGLAAMITGPKTNRFNKRTRSSAGQARMSAAPSRLFLLRHPDPLDLPLELDIGGFFHALAHGLAQTLDVGSAGVAEIDQEVAMQLGDLGATEREPAAAGGVDELPG